MVTPKLDRRTAGGKWAKALDAAGAFIEIWPVGLRAVLPSWAGVALGVLKDSALVSVLGYVELLRASQILITRTQEPFLILTVVGAFYFALSFPISRITSRLERRWQYD